MSTQDDDDKALCIVFERTIPKKDSGILDHWSEVQDKKMVADRQILRKSLMTKKQDSEMTNNLACLKFVHLVKAVQMASESESLIIDKFVSDIDNMVTRFRSEFSKWRDVMENIKKKIPELQATN